MLHDTKVWSSILHYMFNNNYQIITSETYKWKRSDVSESYVSWALWLADRWWRLVDCDPGSQWYLGGNYDALSESLGASQNDSTTPLPAHYKCHLGFVSFFLARTQGLIKPCSLSKLPLVPCTVHHQRRLCSKALGGWVIALLVFSSLPGRADKFILVRN